MRRPAYRHAHRTVEMIVEFQSGCFLSERISGFIFKLLADEEVVEVFHHRLCPYTRWSGS